MSEEKFACPRCGSLVSKGDKFCSNCGLSLAEVGAPSTQPQSEVISEKPYERKFSFFARLLKVLFSPSEGMRDAALAPNYGEVFGVLAFEILLASVVIALVFTKVQFVDSIPPSFWGILAIAIVFALILAFGLLVVRWLIKSLIVKAACNAGSSWDFRTAASITGYAYLAEVTTSLLGLLISWFFIPSMKINVRDAEAAQRAIADFQAQLGLVRFWYSLPISFVGLAWKSYLGGLGTYFGTRGKCSLSLGFAVFFCLGLISLLISLILSI
ncbi:MAG: zinc ribbon domain-containing protein [Candidatus Bathyarchaeia archaeon]